MAEMTAQQKELFERARKGVLTFLQESGGKLPMDALHDYSMQKFFIQHQGFSRMMETFVDEGLVDFELQGQMTTLTDAGRKFISQ